MKSISLFIVLFFIAGCGYHFPGQAGALPEGVEKLYIPLFVNKTAEPQLEYQLTSHVSEVFARNSKISQVESRDLAEATLLGTIRDYNSRALSYDSQDDISEYRSTMVVDIVLVQAVTEMVLMEKTVSWSAEYSADDDKSNQEGHEQEAVEELSLRLAEELLYQALDDF